MKKVDQIKKNIEALRKAYPKAFNDKYPPLKVGIHKDIAGESATDSQRMELAQAMRYWCLNISYLKNLAAGGHRYALDGSECGEVLQEESKGAEAALNAVLERMKQAKLAKKSKKGKKHDK